MATFSGVAIFEAAAGVLLGGVLGLPATVVSILFVIPIPGYLIGAAISGVIATRKSEKSALQVGLIAITVGSLVVFIPGLMGLTDALTLVGGATIYFSELVFCSLQQQRGRSPLSLIMQEQAARC